ncbi:MAG: portal protein [Leptospiraceae bacterium]|nr:portal protein [Leptospiraceae bacterium]MDW8306971.1 potassium transporter TrkG [Leptospiraceae bacterium]
MHIRKFQFKLWQTYLGARRLYALLTYFYLQYAKPFLSLFYFIAGLLSLSILISEIGFSYSERVGYLFETSAEVVIIYMVCYELLSVVFSDKDWRQRIYIRRYQLIVVLGVLLQLFFYDTILSVILDIYGFTPREAALLVLGISQITLLSTNLLHLLRRLEKLQLWQVPPALIFAGSFLLLILIGFLFLCLPKAHRERVPYIDLFFTAVSAVCVTGLSTIDIGTDLTRTGQTILLLLIQIGGLGLMTLTAFFSYFLAGRVSLREHLAIKDLLSESSLANIKQLLLKIALLTLVAESSGALFLYLFDIPEENMSSSERIFYALFHAISAFCNAGFSLYQDNFTKFAHNPGYLITIITLIVAGGLGFSVLGELVSLSWLTNKRLSTLSLVVIMTSLLLILAGTLVFYFSEKEHAFRSIKEEYKILNALFLSVTARTAGFNTMDIHDLKFGSTLFCLALMFIGASPGSTGGGIKTTTAALLFLSVLSFLRGKNRLDIRGRTISVTSQVRAFAVATTSLILVFFSLLSLSYLEADKEVLDVVFEVFSAHGTVGLSRGITPALSTEGKIILCLTMFAGRVGVLNLFLLLIPKKKEVHYDYPTEYLMVG